MTVGSGSRLVLGSGGYVALGEAIAEGEHGAVYEVVGRWDMVCKIYSPRALAEDPTLPRRVQVMVAQPPEAALHPPTGRSQVAWPADLVADESGRVAGYLMSAVSMRNTVGIRELSSPAERAQAAVSGNWYAGFTWRDLVRTALSLASVTRMLHEAEVVVGDIDPRKIRVSTEARTVLLGCDAMQVRDRTTGEIYRYRGGMPEHVAPEVAATQGAYRTPTADLFTLAIYVYQLLMEGEHPFRGIWTGFGEIPDAAGLIRSGTWIRRSAGDLVPPASAIPINHMPEAVMSLFRRAFEDGAAEPAARPSAAEWQSTLTFLSQHLTACSADASHVYYDRNVACPWCAYARNQTVLKMPSGPMPLLPPTAWGPAGPPPGGAPSGPYPAVPAAYPAVPGAPSGPYPAVPGAPSGPYPAVPYGPSGSYATVAGAPLGAYPTLGRESAPFGAQQTAGTGPSGYGGEPETPTYYPPYRRARANGLSGAARGWIAAGLAVLVVGGGVGLGLALTRHHTSPDTSSSTHTSNGTVSGISGGARSSTGPDSPGTSGGDGSGGGGVGTGGQQAESPDATTALNQMYAILQASGTDRAAITNAIVAARDHCEDLDTDQQVFEQASTDRAQQEQQVQELDMSQVPQGEQLQDDLVSALDWSKKADDAYAMWIGDLQGGCTVSTSKNYSSYRQANDDSQQGADPAKQVFADAWNSVAPGYGLPTLEQTDF